MSTFNEADMTCPQCQEEFRATVWTAVHAGEDPELKELLLGGELNMVCCPHCSHIFHREHFLLYQDPLEEIVAYVHPESEKDRAQELGIMMRKGFVEAQAVFEEKKRYRFEPMLMFGLESLVEMLQAEEGRKEQEDIAEAICKEREWPLLRLAPSLAREKGLPRIFPLTHPTLKPTRDDIIAGLQELLKENPALDVYASAQKIIEADTGWCL